MTKQETWPLEQPLRATLRAAADQYPLPTRLRKPSALLQPPSKRRPWPLSGAAAAALVMILATAITSGIFIILSGGYDSVAPGDGQGLPPEISDYADGALLALPVDDPVIVSSFGARSLFPGGAEQIHEGIDFAAVDDAPIYAAADGTVAAVERHPDKGNIIRVDHGTLNGTSVETLYTYRQPAQVKVGDPVRRGQQIAVAGSNPGLTGPVIHFEVHIDGTPVDPMQWLQR